MLTTAKIVPLTQWINKHKMHVDYEARWVDLDMRRKIEKEREVVRRKSKKEKIRKERKSKKEKIRKERKERKSKKEKIRKEREEEQRRSKKEEVKMEREGEEHRKCNMEKIRDEVGVRDLIRECEKRVHAARSAKKLIEQLYEAAGMTGEKEVGKSGVKEVEEDDVVVVKVREKKNKVVEVKEEYEEEVDSE